MFAHSLHTLRTRLAGAAVALAALWTGAPSFAEPPAFGRLVFGAPLDDVRAAFPEAAWSVHAAERHSLRITEISAPDIATFADMPFAARIHEGRYGAYSTAFTHSETVANAAACEAKGLALVAALEPRFGAFHSSVRQPPPAPLNWSVTHSANGVIGVTPVPGVRPAGEESVRAGAQSTATVGGWRRNFAPVSRRRFSHASTEQFELHTAAALDESGGEIRLHVAADYVRGACEVAFQLVRAMTPPPPTFVAFDEARLTSRPTISGMHYQIARLSPPPAEGVDFSLACRVDRETGSVRACQPSSPVSEAARPYLDAATARARAYRLELGDIDRDDPIDMTTQLAVRIAPSDQRPIDFLNAAARPLRDIQWRRGMTSQDLRQVYPARALRLQQTASLTLTCQIQNDLSVICGDARAADPAMLPVFEGAAHRIAERLLAADTLADGSPAAGIVFNMQVDFRIAE
jgi:hypothetical protein